MHRRRRDPGWVHNVFYLQPGDKLVVTRLEMGDFTRTVDHGSFLYLERSHTHPGRLSYLSWMTRTGGLDLRAQGVTKVELRGETVFERQEPAAS